LGGIWRGCEIPELTSLTGVAGEHYVLFELLRKGYIAALAPTGVPDADIVVTIHCAGGGTQPWVFREHRTMAEVVAEETA
jgi:hypothetical protein